VADVHAKRYLWLLPVATERAFTDQEPDKEPAVEVAQCSGHDAAF
jgi:hypothetical protein